MKVENFWDELWIGVKGQSNSVIAGSLRNAFRCSVRELTTGGIATDFARGSTGLPNNIKLRIPVSSIRAVRQWMLRSIVERGRALTIV